MKTRRKSRTRKEFEFLGASPKEKRRNNFEKVQRRLSKGRGRGRPRDGPESERDRETERQTERERREANKPASVQSPTADGEITKPLARVSSERQKRSTRSKLSGGS